MIATTILYPHRSGQEGAYYAKPIVTQPEWVGILDFEQHFPSAIEAGMSGE